MPVIDINGTAVEFPDDMTPEALNAAAALAHSQLSMQPQQRRTGEKIMRGVGLFGQGMNNAIGATMGAPVDAANWMMKQPARMLPENVRGMLPDLPPSGFYTGAAQGALNAFGRNDTPETPVERNLMATGEGVGNAASVFLPAAVASQAPGMVGRVASTMAANPIMQATAGGVGGSVTQATDSPVAGAAAALAVPLSVMAARGLVSPGGVRPSAEQRRLVDVAAAEGIPLTPGQTTGSRPLRTVESVFATLPSTAGAQEARNQTQREAFNRAAMTRAGVAGENLATPEVLQTARERIGGEIGQIAARNEMQVNAGVMQNVQQIATDARRYLPADKARPVLNRVADFIDKIDTRNFRVNGEAYAKLDSALSTQIRAESDGNVRNVLQNLRDALRQGMDASISGADADAWQLARRQYANLSLIARAMNSPNASTAAGNIPPASLSQALASGPQRNYAFGRGDMNDLTRVGRAFIQDAVPNSGTPERMFIQGLLSGAPAGAVTGDLGSAVSAAALGLAAPRVAQAAYYSPLMQQYLTNQLATRALPQITPGLMTSIGAGQARQMIERR